MLAAVCGELCEYCVSAASVKLVYLLFTASLKPATRASVDEMPGSTLTTSTLPEAPFSRV